MVQPGTKRHLFYCPYILKLKLLLKKDNLSLRGTKSHHVMFAWYFRLFIWAATAYGR